mmetsp:Transcript_16913/g.26391  ORF Transcript_16913/g.26391 Transcript_16913/m.26391 type:complete len:98 (-) Transcript_16913:1471-1764(-)
MKANISMRNQIEKEPTAKFELNCVDEALMGMLIRRQEDANYIKEEGNLVREIPEIFYSHVATATIKIVMFQCVGKYVRFSSCYYAFILNKLANAKGA